MTCSVVCGLPMGSSLPRLTLVDRGKSNAGLVLTRSPVTPGCHNHGNHKNHGNRKESMETMETTQISWKPHRYHGNHKNHGKPQRKIETMETMAQSVSRFKMSNKVAFQIEYYPAF